MGLPTTTSKRKTRGFTPYKGEVFLEYYLLTEKATDTEEFNSKAKDLVENGYVPWYAPHWDATGTLISQVFVKRGIFIC